MNVIITIAIAQAIRLWPIIREYQKYYWRESHEPMSFIISLAMIR